MADGKVYRARFLPQLRYWSSLTKDIEITLSEEICFPHGAARFTSRLVLINVVKRYRSAQLMLSPRRLDNIPDSLLEVMASGVPIVSARVGGVPHLVEDGRDALLVPPGDFVAMADAAVKVLRDRELARRLARSGIASARRRYTWADVKLRLLFVYARALGVASLTPRAS